MLVDRIKGAWNTLTGNSLAAEIPASESDVSQDLPTKSREVHSYGYNSSGSVYTNTGPVAIINGVYNGEKSEGSLGAAMNLFPDHRALRFRAHEFNLTNPIARIVTGKFFKFVVGNGLNFQAEPYEKLLLLDKITVDIEAFKSNIEPRFDLFASSTRSDFSGMVNLHANARKHFETKFLGGDSLIICRIDNNFDLTVQVIDGQHINSPLMSNSLMQQSIANGRRVIQGVEIDDTGRHTAYFVRKIGLQSSLWNNFGTTENYERIEAYSNSTGIPILMTWMGYGLKARTDHVRGIPVISSILETAEVLGRYTEATVQTAEERSKVVFVVEHGKTSDGINPYLDRVRAGTGAGISPDSYVQGEVAAKNMSVSENRQVHNLPVDSKLMAVSSQSEIQYEPFFKSVFNQICAAVDIPPEVAMQLYSSNYSASRAAINAWAYILDIYRQALVDDFYKPIYDLYLMLQILKGKIDAPGYLEAMRKGDRDVMEAYSGAKFTGANMPHIDPLKEINALRAALGEAFANIPLISPEQAAELGNYGDFETNIKKAAQQKKMADDLGIGEVEPEPTGENKTDKTEKES